jgi:hypothetical protein
MKRAIFGFLSLIVWLALAGCGGTPPPTRLTQSVGTLTATITVSPYPPVPMQTTSLELRLEDADQPVTGATVGLTLTMPGCPMAPNYPETVEREEGVYRTQTVLTMAGVWQADADILLPGREVQFTFFFATK